MINADKYLKDGVDVEQLYKDLKEECGNRVIYPESMKRFFAKPVKPTLTEDEKVILNEVECFQKGFSSMDKIHRTKNGDLYITKFWKDFGEEIRLPYNHLFQFIQDGEEYSIKELLGDE